MENMNLSKMMPPQREIENYLILVKDNWSEFNKEASELIKVGYEPIGMLVINNGYYVKEFIKYKAL